MAEVSQYTMKPWEMDQLTRFDVFEIYLKPDQKQVEEEPLRSHRERSFEHWLLNGFCKTWEECERKWQKISDSKGLETKSPSRLRGSGGA